MEKKRPKESRNDSTSSSEPDKDESEDSIERERIPDRPAPIPKLSSGKRFAQTNKIGIIAAAISSILVISYFNGISPSLEEQIPENMADKIRNYVHAWRSNYPHQNRETWSTIAGQISEFVRSGHKSPLVFVMAYSEAVKTTDILASEISHAALHLKNGIDECGDEDISKIFGSDQRIKPGFLLNNFVQKIEKCRKLILYNLEELDGSVAKDLHSLLDSDYPNVHSTVYIFTVKIPISEGNVYYEVQNTLRSHWSPKIGDDILNPLLSRILNNIKIIPEPVFEY